MQTFDDIRARAIEVGTEIFNAPTEGAVADLHRAGFPLPIPGCTRTAELTMCRLVLAAGGVAEALGIPPRDYWGFFRASVLDGLMAAHLTDDLAKRQWAELECRFLDAAFGPPDEEEEGET